MRHHVRVTPRHARVVMKLMVVENEIVLRTLVIECRDGPVVHTNNKGKSCPSVTMYVSGFLILLQWSFIVLVLSLVQ